MKRFTILLLAIFMITGFFSCRSSDELYDLRNSQNPSLLGLSTIPPEFSSAASLEFKGVTSDFFLLKVMTYIGKLLLERTQVDDNDWQYALNILKLSTTLDPKFWDPYLLTQSMVVMQGGLVEEGNALLEKAAEHRENDYRPYFLLWYNNYALSPNPEMAEQYLYKAIERPNAPSYLPGIASRMSLKSNKIGSSILVLTELKKQTLNPTIKDHLSRRITTLQIIGYLENAINEYSQKHGVAPKILDDLVADGLVSAIPDDPYGGNFYITKNGRVYTTSKMVPVKTKH